MGKNNTSGSAIILILRKSWFWLLLLLALCVVPFVKFPEPEGFWAKWWGLAPALYRFLCVTVLLFLTLSICRNLTDYFSLKKNETGITICQITILAVVGIWVLAFLIIFNVKESRYFWVAGVLGTLLGWIFQDTIKGVAAFIHLRLNHLLNIDDWIVVPKLNVDGEVKHITLTTVTIYNWDTTTSSIPTSVLHSDHFINYQKMTTGKTYGRRMVKSFILDTNWFFHITADDAERLKKQNDLKRYLPEEEIHEGALNAQLYRLYLYHWLMSHPKVSQKPNLVVRWLEQKESGMPLQVYAYITEGGMAAFEWQQSQIIEHIMESLDWFGLRLYQSPSSYDAGNTNVHMTDAEAVYRKEVGQ